VLWATTDSVISPDRPLSPEDHDNNSSADKFGISPLCFSITDVLEGLTARTFKLNR
jgi:hypothetical protein